MRNSWLRVMMAGVCLAGLAATAGGQVVVTNTYENFEADRALAGAVVTFSRIGAAGDFTKGITPAIGGVRLPAQVDVLRRAKDGSIRHALVSFVLPSLPAGGTVKIDWLNARAADPPAFKWAFDRSAFDCKLVLAPAAGRAVTSDVGRIVSAGWSASERVKVLHDGPVMKEFEVRDIPADAQGNPDKHVEVFWRLRVFSGERSVRVAAVVERCKPRRKGYKEPIQYKFSGVKLLSGDRALYEGGAYDHLDQTRYRILVWTAGALEDIHRRPNYDYWLKGRFIPLYRWSDKPRTPEQVDATYTKPSASRPALTRGQGILENGMIERHMPGTGGRWEMMPYPAWTACYLLSGAPKTYRALLHADGNGGGAFYVHVRQGGAPGYNVYTVSQRPLGGPYRMPLYRLPDGTKVPRQPDHAHAPSLGYVSYLLTGDKYYAEEMSFWASYDLGEYPYRGIDHNGPERAQAWQLRQTADAAFILPKDHPLQSYFAQSVNKYLEIFTEKFVKSGRKVHFFRAEIPKRSGALNWVNCTRTLAWTYSWLVWSLNNAVDKGFDSAVGPRDWAAEYNVGFYASDDEFVAPDGKTYRYDPRDAMPYGTAAQLWETKIVRAKDGSKDIQFVRKIKDLDNYGAIWYYTKLNQDNEWSLFFEGDRRGVQAEPDANGVWPLRKDGWGGGMYYDHMKQRQAPWWGWHRYGAWVSIVTAVEADVPNARKAWETMRKLAGPSRYGFEMAPRIKD